MAKASPLESVKKNFGSRADLVSKLADTVEDIQNDGTKLSSRLYGLTNKKLLRLYKIEQTVRERFGDKDKLIDHIVAAHKAAGKTADDAFIAKLKTYSKGRLLDMTRQRHDTKPEKQTPEQRMRSKRGRKQIERAKAKIG